MTPEQQLEKVKDYIGYKSVLIVGNGEVYNPKANADIIVRLNLGGWEGCNIWVDHIAIGCPEEHLAVHRPQCDLVLRLKPTIKCLHPADYSSPKKEWFWLQKETGLEIPTTGLVTLWWFKKYFPDNQKLITGFDGEKNRYNNIPMHGLGGRPPGGHKMAKEREIVREWLERGYFRSV